MYKNPPFLGPEVSLSEAVALMIKKKLAGIPIVNPDKTVCGLLSSENVIQLIGMSL